MNILYIGQVVNLDDQNKFSGCSVAGNKMQHNILSNLVDNDSISLNFITVLPVAAFPKDKHLYYTKQRVHLVKGLEGTAVSFINLPFIKQFCQIMNTYKLAKSKMDKDTVVLTYNMYPQIGLPAKWLKKKYGCKIISVIADLPIDDSAGHRSGIGEKVSDVFNSITKNNIRECDGIIALNKNAVDKYAPNTPYVIVEGGVNLEEYPKDPITQVDSKCLVYSGALTDYSGVKQLVDAMDFVQSDVTLEIYGGGYLEEYIKQKSLQNKKVVFKGSVDNKTMLEIQRNSYILVNPRPTDDPISQVTFPSKMFEYMMSGRPVLTTRLNGLSEEYLEHLFFIEDESPKGIAAAINEMIGYGDDKLGSVAKGARSFIEREKNWKRQGKKIFDFVSLISES